MCGVCELWWLEDVVSLWGCGEVEMYVKSRTVFGLELSIYFKVARSGEKK